MLCLASLWFWDVAWCLLSCQFSKMFAILWLVKLSFYGCLCCYLFRFLAMLACCLLACLQDLFFSLGVSLLCVRLLSIIIIVIVVFVFVGCPCLYVLALSESWLYYLFLLVSMHFLLCDYVSLFGDVIIISMFNSCHGGYTTCYFLLVVVFASVYPCVVVVGGLHLQRTKALTKMGDHVLSFSGSQENPVACKSRF